MFDRLCSRAITLYGSSDFELARSEAWESACSLVEDGCTLGVDRSQVILYRLNCYKLRLLVSESDKILHSRIAKGEAILQEETRRILNECPGAVLKEIPIITKYLETLSIFRAWLQRPASMWEIEFDPPRYRKIILRDPHTIQVKSSTPTGVSA